MSIEDMQIEQHIIKCDNCGASPLPLYFMCDQDQAYLCNDCFNESKCCNEHEEGCSTAVIEGDA